MTPTDTQESALDKHRDNLFKWTMTGAFIGFFVAAWFADEFLGAKFIGLRGGLQIRSNAGAVWACLIFFTAVGSWGARWAASLCRCQHCRGIIHREATTCRHCSRSVSPNYLESSFF